MSFDNKKVTMDHIESDQSYVETLSKEDIEKMIAEITPDSIQPIGSIHVPSAWKKPGMHYHYARVDIGRYEELTKQFKLRPSRNDKGECHYLENGNLILMETPIEIHEHTEKLKNQAKKEATEAIIEKGSAIKSPGIYQTSDSKSSKEFFD